MASGQFDGAQLCFLHLMTAYLVCYQTKDNNTKQTCGIWLVAGLSHVHNILQVTLCLMQFRHAGSNSSTAALVSLALPAAIRQPKAPQDTLPTAFGFTEQSFWFAC